MNWIKTIRVAAGIIACVILQINALGQQVIPLYNGGKPYGSEHFTIPEKTDSK